MRRREQREHVFKLLFIRQFHSQEAMEEQLELYRQELGDTEEKDWEFIRGEYVRVLEHLDEIDAVLNEYSTGWKTSRMSRVDIVALRLAVYEMKYEEDVPVGVAINEAVELAKSFGGETSGSFVNGVLGKIAGGRKDSPGDPKPARRPRSQAKIILRSNKKAEDAAKARQEKRTRGGHPHAEGADEEASVGSEKKVTEEKPIPQMEGAVEEASVGSEKKVTEEKQIPQTEGAVDGISAGSQDSGEAGRGASENS